MMKIPSNETKGNFSHLSSIDDDDDDDDGAEFVFGEKKLLHFTPKYKNESKNDREEEEDGKML
jgi:hypothetical protein